MIYPLIKVYDYVCIFKFEIIRHYKQIIQKFKTENVTYSLEEII